MGRRALPLAFIQDKKIRERSSGKRLVGAWKKLAELGVYSGAEVTVTVKFPDAEQSVFHNGAAPLTIAPDAKVFNDRQLFEDEIMGVYPPTLRSAPYQKRPRKNVQKTTPENTMLYLPFPERQELTEESAENSKTDSPLIDCDENLWDLLMPPTFVPIAQMDVGPMRHRVAKTLKESHLAPLEPPAPVRIRSFVSKANYWEEE